MSGSAAMHDNGAPPSPMTASALETGLRSGQVGVWRWRLGSDDLQWSPNLAEVHGLPPEAYNGRLSSFQADLHPDDAERVRQAIDRTVATGEAYRVTYRAAPRPGAAERWLEACGELMVDGNGNRFLTGVCQDVSERVRNEQLLQRRLAQQSAVAQFGTYALGETSLDDVMWRAVALAAEVLEVPLTKILRFADSADHLDLCAGLGWAEGLVGRVAVGTELQSQAGYTLLSGAPVIVRDLRRETRFSGPQLLHDHGVRSGISVVIPGNEARHFGVFGIHSPEVREFDQTDAEFLQALANIVAGAARQAKAVESQGLLIREMAHRAGNMLQLVNSIASQTFSLNTDIPEALQAFSERLSALARSNYVISSGGWTSTRLLDVVSEVIRPFETRIDVQGRDILLPPELCFDLGLVLHELATNSVKYGALGAQDGSVKLTWALHPEQADGQMLQLAWEDSVSRSPVVRTGAGFGAKLVRALVERKWGGTMVEAREPHYRLDLLLRAPAAERPASGTER